MSEENVNQTEEPEEIRAEEKFAQESGDATPPPASRRFFSRRNFFISFAALASIVLLLVLAAFLAFRFGYFDRYVKDQFITKMDEIGITFTADVFRTNLSPMSLDLGNATFVDKVTGEKLFHINSARIGLSATNLYAWQLSRDFRVDSTDIDGVEVWVRFDENGNSNFSNLKFVDEQRGFVNFNYTSARFAVKNGLIHFGDVQRKISADAKNVALTIEPENLAVSDEQKRYRFDLTSTDSVVVYDEKAIDPVDLYVKGLAYREGAEITELRLTSPVANSTLSGNIEGWDPFRYNFKIDSSVDLMQAATIFPNGTVLRGIGNFSGTVVGEGERYKIDGEIQSDALAASNVTLKKLQVNATVEVDDSIYNANGKAIAEMLTFEDFRIDFPQLIGNVRGNGTNFKWVGELQAAAARTPSGTLSGLYVSDAVAEYEDDRFDANFGNVMARRFLSEDADIAGLQARNVKLSNFNDTTNVSLPNLRANTIKVEGAEMRGVNAGNIQIQNRGSSTTVGAGNLRADNIRTNDAQLNGVTANNIKLRNQGAQTNVEAGNLRADNVQTDDARLRNVRANGVNLSSRNGATDIRANNLQAAQVDASGARIGNLNATNVDAKIRGNQTDVVAGNLKVARVETNAAILGSLNVAGVRLSIRQGRIEGSSGDINAGNVTLTKAAIPQGGTLEDVRIARPVFVLEPSGRYRASLDMSLGGGVLGSVRLGAARANVVASNDQVALNNLSAEVMDGSINGDAVIATNNRNQSRVNAEFANLDLAKLLALQGGRVIPIAGNTTGRVDLTFPGTNIRTASGTLTADFTANAGTTERGLVPVNGNVALRATNGLFDIESANLNTEKSAVTATGRFDLEGENSNLNLALNSTDASEIERLIKVLNISPELEEQLASNEVALGGKLTFNGTLTGNLSDPTVNGRAALDSIALRGRELGSLSTDIFVSPLEITLRNGNLRERDGTGNLAFNVNVPRGGTDNITVQATLDRVNTGNLLAALPVTLPAALRDFQGETSGSINLSGLPNGISGEVNLSSGGATVAGQTVDGFDTRITIQNSVARIERFEARFADGVVRASGNYQTNTGVFNFDLEGRGLQLAKLRPLLSKDDSLPALAGVVDLTAKATGDTDDFSTFDVNFNGAGQNITVNENALGTVSFVGNTANQVLTANLTATLGNQPQTIAATLNFGDPNLPFRAETNFNQTELAPLLALLSPPQNVEVSGRATGRVYLEGNLYGTDAAGNRAFTTENLRGEARFTQLSLLIGETPFVATDPLAVRFNADAIVVDNAQFTGGGSNVVVTGTKALSNNAVNNLSIDGRVNLRVLDVLSQNTFFSGLADVAVRLTGPNADPRFTGTASLANATFSTFIGSERLAVNRINGRVLFNSNQAQLDNLTGFVGGGKIVATGGALIGKGFQLQRHRIDLRGDNVTTPLADGFIATADVDISTGGELRDGVYRTDITGRVVARRAVYTKDIDLADIIGNRREGLLGGGGGGGGGTSSNSPLGAVRVNVTIEARDTLFIRNNIAEVAASADLRIAGDISDPVILGRITASRGVVTFRNDRYDVQRAVIEFPPQNDGAPFINLQAETEIQGYQIVVSLLGDLSNPDALSAVVRSNPGLPQADVISLITTGNLANTGEGIPTIAQTGINTAAELITDALINDPLRKATDRLFGLNRFEIDPVVSGRRLGAGARLTVGRQINRNLLVTYSTNLSEDQNQILALEYRVSNRLSFVAQYEQRSLSNVTRTNDNFSFEIRFRKRF